MTPEGFLLIRPYLLYAVGLLSDYAIARGWLLPDQRQQWVDAWVQIITAAGSVLLSAIVVWHEFKKPHPTLTKTTSNTTVVTPTSAPETLSTTSETMAQ